MDWNNYMQGFACRCAKIVKSKGWKVFGLQFYGTHSFVVSKAASTRQTIAKLELEN